MASNNLLNLSVEEAIEMPMVDMAYELLRLKREAMPYLDIMGKIAEIKKFSEEDVNRVIAQLYTQMNIDGRFALQREKDESRWGLRRWYAHTLEDTVGANRLFVDEDDDDDDYVDTEEDEESTEVEVDEYNTTYAEDAEDLVADEAVEEVEGLEETIEDEELDEDLSDKDLDDEEDFEIVDENSDLDDEEEN